jgi:integrase
MAEISPLRRRMIEDMTVRNLSPATQRSYLAAVSKLSRYFGRSPDCLELEDIRAFQVHLVAIGISWPALNQIVCALRFFCGVMLGQDAIPERISYARQNKLPVVLSADEVVRFLEAIRSLNSRTALTTVYAAGLRVSEVVLLKIADIDSQRMVIRVEQGKGGKDVTSCSLGSCCGFSAAIGGWLNESSRLATQTITTMAALWKVGRGDPRQGSRNTGESPPGKVRRHCGRALRLMGNGTAAPVREIQTRRGWQSILVTQRRSCLSPRSRSLSHCVYPRQVSPHLSMTASQSRCGR